MSEGEAGSRQQAAGSKKSFFPCPPPAPRLSSSKSARRLLIFCLLPAACCLLCFGCGGSPSAANIQLRKENQKLSAQLEDLTRQHAADQATLQASQGKNGITPALTNDRLEKLFTAHDLSLGRLTGGHQPSGSSFDDGLIVYAVPTDDDGEPIKAAGSFKVEAFDLDNPAHPLIGQWSFNRDQTRKLFYAHLSLYTYVLNLPWQTTPKPTDLTLHVTFLDELTGRQLTAQRVVKVNPPPR
jgi:hypothetical protein